MRRVTIIRSFAIAAVLNAAGCAGGNEAVSIPYPDASIGDTAPGPTPSGVTAVCKVNVTAGPTSTASGQRDVETEYLPRVLWCGNGQQQRHAELLRARAVAARTYVYRKVQSSGSVANTAADLLYMAPGCEGTIPQEFVDAVAQTKQQVMLDASGNRLASGVVYAGQADTCQKAANCNGLPCMGQAEAAACAASGYDWRAILNLFFDAPTIIQAQGSCDSPDPSTSYGTCSYNGHSGVCQQQSTTCFDGNGKYWDKLCANAPAGVYCCLPANAMTTPGPGTPTTQYGNCYSAGKQGTCKKQSEGCTNGKFYGGLCSNVPTDVYCCLLDDATPAPAPDYGNCNKDPFTTYKCLDTTKDSCSGTLEYKTGYCTQHSSADIKCCAPKDTSTSYGNCNKDPYTAYKCQDTTTESCSGTLEYKTGYCTQHNSANIKCCAPKDSTPPSYGNCTKDPYTAYKCQDSTKDTCSGTLEYKTGYCTQHSSADIKCCAPKAASTSYGNCNKAPYTAYKCLDSTTESCSGSLEYKTGYCTQHSSADIKCCAPVDSTTNPDAQYYGQACDTGGVCQSVKSGYGGGFCAWKQKLCPGSSDVQCCIPSL